MFCQRQIVGFDKLGRHRSDLGILMAAGVNYKKDPPLFAVILRPELRQQRPVLIRQLGRRHRPVAPPAAATLGPVGKAAQAIGPAMKGGQKGRRVNLEGDDVFICVRVHCFSPFILFISAIGGCVSSA
ncbi:MAG: hypothetical protein L6276_05060 [Acetobacterium sp.]|nr:hypothetical protein [Acetobacterium sp.]